MENEQVGQNEESAIDIATELNEFTSGLRLTHVLSGKTIEYLKERMQNLFDSIKSESEEEEA